MAAPPSPVSASRQERVELAPKLRAAWRELPLFVLGGIVLTTLLVLRGDPLVMVLGGDVVAGAFFVAFFIGARRLRVFADEDGAGWVDRLGRTRRFPPGTRMQYLRTLGGASQLFIAFIGPDGRRLFSSAARAWDVVQLESLCTRCGIEIEAACTS